MGILTLGKKNPACFGKAKNNSWQSVPKYKKHRKNKSMSGCAMPMVVDGLSSEMSQGAQTCLSNLCHVHGFPSHHARTDLTGPLGF